MLSKGIRLIIAFFIPALIIALIIISILLPSKNSSKEEMKIKAERLYNELSAICISEGHIRSEARNNCVQDKLFTMYGD